MMNSMKHLRSAVYLIITSIAMVLLMFQGNAAAQSCQGICGEQSTGGCWCDDQCEGYGDCCNDYVAECFGPVGCGDSGEFCGGQSPDGCWCDDKCQGFGDCCVDINPKVLQCGGSLCPCFDAVALEDAMREACNSPDGCGVSNQLNNSHTDKGDVEELITKTVFNLTSGESWPFGVEFNQFLMFSKCWSNDGEVEISDVEVYNACREVLENSAGMCESL